MVMVNHAAILIRLSCYNGFASYILDSSTGHDYMLTSDLTSMNYNHSYVIDCIVEIAMITQLMNAILLMLLIGSLISSVMYPNINTILVFGSSQSAL